MTQGLRRHFETYRPMYTSLTVFLLLVHIVFSTTTTLYYWTQALMYLFFSTYFFFLYFVEVDLNQEIPLLRRIFSWPALYLFLATWYFTNIIIGFIVYIQQS